MRTSICLAVVTVILGTLAFVPSVNAQYYGYGYGNYYPQAAPQVGNPYYYYMRPDPHTQWMWNRQNREADYEALIRSPRDRETELEYMLRTF